MFFLCLCGNYSSSKFRLWGLDRVDRTLLILPGAVKCLLASPSASCAFLRESFLLQSRTGASLTHSSDAMANDYTTAVGDFGGRDVWKRTVDDDSNSTALQLS